MTKKPGSHLNRCSISHDCGGKRMARPVRSNISSYTSFFCYRLHMLVNEAGKFWVFWSFSFSFIPSSNTGKINVEGGRSWLAPLLDDCFDRIVPHDNDRLLVCLGRVLCLLSHTCWGHFLCPTASFVYSAHPFLQKNKPKPSKLRLHLKGPSSASCMHLVRLSCCFIAETFKCSRSLAEGSIPAKLLSPYLAEQTHVALFVYFITSR